jgi:hypothetical protein
MSETIFSPFRPPWGLIDMPSYVKASNTVFSSIWITMCITLQEVMSVLSDLIGPDYLGMIQGFGQNLNSATETPNFVSATNLHLTAPGSASAIESGAVVISGLTTDIDGDTQTCHYARYWGRRVFGHSGLSDND